MKLRSARCQLAYWDAGRMRIVNYLTRTTFAADPAALELIRYFVKPRSARGALKAFKTYSRQSVGQAIVELIDTELLLVSGSPESKRDLQLARAWKTWLPGAAFHFLTKDAPFIGGLRTTEQRFAAVAKTPMPAQFKRIGGAPVIYLPNPRPNKDSFFDTLHARRTHREFSGAAVALRQVALLLKLTWGVQGYRHSEVFGPLPIKTSPSGGARHSIEVHLMALHVDGLRPGLYHYRSDDHRLERMSPQADPHMARDFCADQPWVADAAAIFIMTSVFARDMWKYQHARAYRVVLLDAGHLGQTFCLTATRMGLAPFCSAALKDTLIEDKLQLDGITESPLYVVGVGRRR
jgi:SagB-type dehydrogenase family enzyme